MLMLAIRRRASFSRHRAAAPARSRACWPAARSSRDRREHRRERVGDSRPRTRACPSASRRARSRTPRCRRACRRVAARLLGAHVRGGPENHPRRATSRACDRRRLRRRLTPRACLTGASIAFARPKSRTLTCRPAALDVRRLQIAVDDPLLVCGFERLGDLLRDRQRLVERMAPSADPLRQVLAIDELHDERREPGGFLEPVDCGDVRMIQRRERLGLALEARQAFGSAANASGRTLDRDLAARLRVASRDIPAPCRLRR